MNTFPTRTAIATVAVAVAGAAAFAELTNGFTALTSETSRRLSVETSPILVPNILGVDESGTLRQMLSDPGRAEAEGTPRVVIVDFIYTRCVTVCSALGSSFQQLQTQLKKRGLINNVRLLTISMDPAHDTPAALAKYALNQHADPRIWTVMSPARIDQLPSLLKAFGIVVVPAPFDQLQHNAAFHIVDARGRLVRIVDQGDPTGALYTALFVDRALDSHV